MEKGMGTLEVLYGGVAARLELSPCQHLHDPLPQHHMQQVELVLRGYPSPFHNASRRSSTSNHSRNT